MKISSREIHRTSLSHREKESGLTMLAMISKLHKKVFVTYLYYPNKEK